LANDSEALSLLDSIRLLALKSVTEMDAEYRLRFINRWYSRQFHTPLHTVDDLPTEDVLQHFFECMFEDMEEEKRLRSVQELLETKDERQKRLLKEAVDTEDDENWFREVLDDVKAGRDPLRRDSGLSKPKEDVLPDVFKKAAAQLGESVKELEKTVGADAPDEIGFDFGKAFDPNEDWGLFDDPEE